MNANSINRLGFRGVTLVQFIANCAKNVKARYVLTGASALIIRGVIRRETNVRGLAMVPTPVLTKAYTGRGRQHRATHISGSTGRHTAALGRQQE